MNACAASAVSFRVKAVLTKTALLRLSRQFLLWDSVPEPHTTRAGIKMFPASHYLERRNGTARLLQYHDLLSAFRRCVSTTPFCQQRVRNVRRQLTKSTLHHIILNQGIFKKFVLKCAL